MLLIIIYCIDNIYIIQNIIFRYVNLPHNEHQRNELYIPLFKYDCFTEVTVKGNEYDYYILYRVQ